jgi:hypothetical protein
MRTSTLTGAACVLATAVAAQAPAPPTLRTYLDSTKHELVMALGPVSLPANAGHDAMAQPPVVEGEFPASVALHGFRTEVVDMHGQIVPARVIHHINVIDPAHRELFLPISRRLLAVGQETGEQRVPGWLFGMPVTQGQRFLFSAMLHNPTSQEFHGVTIRVIWPYRRVGKVFPMVHVYPFQFDVLFPVGDKSFDLPPGPSSRSWEGSPAIPGRILAVGGHLHDRGVRLVWEDLTTRKVIWDARPIRDSLGIVVGMPVGRLYKRFGVRVEPSHRYRLTAYYENPTQDTLYQGGMGVVGGLFRPGADWPAADTLDQLYQRDLAHAKRLGPRPPPRPAAAAAHHHH